MVPALPHELSDRIVDFLHDDRFALSALSLASRSFLPSARYHRFSRVSLVGRMEEFELVLDASPGIGIFVTMLVLDSGLSYTVWRQLDARYLASMVNGLPALQHLELRYLKVQAEAIQLVGELRRLRTLSLVGCNVPNPDSLARFISSLEHVDHLNVEDLSYRENGTIADHILPPRLGIFGATGLASEATSQICDWILASEESYVIRSFHTRIRSKAEAAAMKSLIANLGGSLSDFNMIVDAEASLGGEPSSHLDDGGRALTKVSLSCVQRIRILAGLPWKSTHMQADFQTAGDVCS